MSFKRGLMMAALPVVGAAIVWGLATAKSPPARWGSDGHRMASRAAMAILPGEAPSRARQSSNRYDFIEALYGAWINSEDLADQRREGNSSS